MTQTVFYEQMYRQKKFLCTFKIKFRTTSIFRIFPILRINGMAPFCNLFIERPSYYTYMSADIRQKLLKCHVFY